MVTSTFTLGGRRGTYGTGLALVAQLGLAGAAAVCVAGLAFGDCSATLGMVPRPAVAIHLYSLCWYAGFGYIT